MSVENLKKKTEVLFKNHQWMVQNDDGTIFLVEVMPNYPGDLDGGYWVKARDLEYQASDGHTMVQHVCEKTWVDIDAFEQAVRYAVQHCGLRPRYDLGEEFGIARKARERDQ
jgi:hypothetical protein